jgi:uncharacterized damage-inducible protein DinB
MNHRPDVNEYIEYYRRYVESVPEGDIRQTLKTEIQMTADTIHKLSEEQGLFRYAPDKWSIKEVLGHMADTEQIMAYRILSIARGESVSLPGFNENSYVETASFNRQSIGELLDRLLAVREATVHLLNGLNEDSLVRKGTANGTQVSARSVAWIIAGHEIHHRTIIRERYIGSVDFQ